MARTMKNRGGVGAFYWFKKRLNILTDEDKRKHSSEKRKRSAEIRHKRFAGLPNTTENIERQEEKRRESMMNRDIASEKTRKLRYASLPRQRVNAASSRRSGYK